IWDAFSDAKSEPCHIQEQEPEQEPIKSIGKPNGTSGGMKRQDNKWLDALEAFQITPQLQEWAVSEGIQDPAKYLDEFKDWWRAREKKAREIKDWPATFRNRLRHLKKTGQLNDGLTLQKKEQRDGTGKLSNSGLAGKDYTAGGF